MGVNLKKVNINLEFVTERIFISPTCFISRAEGFYLPSFQVSERRLRPIYDWLDNGNNKKALQEADKVWMTGW